MQQPKRELVILVTGNEYGSNAKLIVHDDSMQARLIKHSSVTAMLRYQLNICVTQSLYVYCVTRNY